MNVFRKWDSVPPPYSTIMALAFVGLLGVAVMVVRQGELLLLGVGIIVGGFTAIALKKAAEVSDRAVLGRFAEWLQGGSGRKGP